MHSSLATLLIACVGLTAHAQVDRCGDITADEAWGDSTLTCQVFVQSGVTLTIDAGSTISSAADDGAGLAPALVVLPGATISAVGTADAPITFTSTADASELPARGLWGGLIIMGNAPTAGSPQEVEGIEGYEYGGSDAAESSGTLQYVRVWYGGSVIGENNEINGITLAGVGSGTTVENCEVAFNLDDGFEMFGGTVNLKYISALFVGDDAIDTDQGYQGKIQYAYVMIGTSGNHGVEMDSQTDGTTPRSFPQLYSATFVHHLDGVPASVSSDDLRDATLRLRESTGGEFGNIIVTNVPSAGVLQNDCGSETITHDLSSAGTSPDYLWFSSQNIIFGASGITLYLDDDGSCAGLTDAVNSDPQLTLMPGEADEDSPAFDPRPVASGPAYTSPDTNPTDSFFEATSYKGAFDTTLWLEDFSWLADQPQVGFERSVWRHRGRHYVVDERAHDVPSLRPIRRDAHD